MTSGPLERTPHPAIAALARTACWSFAGMLLVSAWFKSTSPGVSASALAWTGLAFESRAIAVDVSAWVEAGLGALLFAAFRSTWVHSLAIMAGSALGVVHLAGMVQSDGGCACFGELEVPDWLTLAVLCAGILGSCVAIRQAGPGRASWPQSGILAIALTIAAVSPTWFREAPPAPEQLLQHVNLPEQMTEVVFVIGSFDCRPCHDELARIDERRRSADQDAARRVFFVTAIGTAYDPTVSERFPWLAHARVPEHLWLRLSAEGSPTFVHFTAGQPLRITTRWPSATPK